MSAMAPSASQSPSGHGSRRREKNTLRPMSSVEIVGTIIPRAIRHELRPDVEDESPKKKYKEAERMQFRHGQSFGIDITGVLYKAYMLNTRPGPKDIEALAKETNLGHAQVRNWFSNRRNRDRRSKKDHAAAGSQHKSVVSATAAAMIGIAVENAEVKKENPLSQVVTPRIECGVDVALENDDSAVPVVRMEPKVGQQGSFPTSRKQSRSPYRRVMQVSNPRTNWPKTRENRSSKPSSGAKTNEQKADAVAPTRQPPPRKTKSAALLMGLASTANAVKEEDLTDDTEDEMEEIGETEGCVEAIAIDEDERGLLTNETLEESEPSDMEEERDVPNDELSVETPTVRHRTSTDLLVGEVIPAPTQTQGPWHAKPGDAAAFAMKETTMPVSPLPAVAAALAASADADSHDGEVSDPDQDQDSRGVEAVASPPPASDLTSAASTPIPSPMPTPPRPTARAPAFARAQARSMSARSTGRNSAPARTRAPAPSRSGRILNPRSEPATPKRKRGRPKMTEAEKSRKRAAAELTKSPTVDKPIALPIASVDPQSPMVEIRGPIIPRAIKHELGKERQSLEQHEKEKKFGWVNPVAAKTRHGQAFGCDITAVLFQAYVQNPRPDNVEVNTLATHTGLLPAQIRNWFSNRRNRDKRCKRDNAATGKIHKTVVNASAAKHLGINVEIGTAKITVVNSDPGPPLDRRAPKSHRQRRLPRLAQARKRVVEDDNEEYVKLALSPEKAKRKRGRPRKLVAEVDEFEDENVDEFEEVGYNEDTVTPADTVSSGSGEDVEAAMALAILANSCA